MNRTPNVGLLAGIALVVALLVINAALSYRNTWQLNEDARWVAHTQEVRAEIAGVLRTLVDAETGYRGFAATGKDEFLEPYTAALVRLRWCRPSIQTNMPTASSPRAATIRLVVTATP